MQKLLNKIKSKKWLVLVLPLLIFIIWLILPCKLFVGTTYSRVIYDRNGKMLRVTLAEDEQFRLPPIRQKLPEKYLRALVLFEDKRFYKHPGIDPLAIVNAARLNFKKRQVVRGGSTITMQLARLSNPKNRTLFNKLTECFVAFKIECHYSKDEILQLYASHVPMGGNTVGIHTAEYRYSDRDYQTITWAEAALFAILPNSPSMINLQKHRQLLIEKRNRLLKKMYEQGYFDEMTCELSCEEPIPELRRGLAFEAPHFCNFVLEKSKKNVVNSTLDMEIQKAVKSVAKVDVEFLQSHGIYNYAILVAETKTGKIRSYIGSQDFYDSEFGGQVDGIQAMRSTGSLLKPFLAAKVIDRGPFNMESKIQDVPTFFGGFVPQNADKEFRGLVTVSDMLVYSLNVPAVRLLNYYGVADFYFFLQKAGLSSLRRRAMQYGLPLIIGGAEASLFELTQMFLSLGNSGQGRQLVFEEKENKSGEDLYSAGSAWLVMEALKKVNRPGKEAYWHLFSNQMQVAWKTGTSYGQKDAWAIGINPQYTVGVWCGNFSGEGNTDLYGSSAAGPILFKVFNAIGESNENNWFPRPDSSLKLVEVCTESGLLPNDHCPETDFVFVPKKTYRVEKCNYHRQFILDKSTGYEVCSKCWDVADTVHVMKTIYPAGVRHIYQFRVLEFDNIPKHNTKCSAAQNEKQFDIIYPTPDVKITVPRNFNVEYESVVFKARHQSQKTKLFWYIDGKYIGTTLDHHEIKIDLNTGQKILSVQDETGWVESVNFEVFKN
ncbi:MAG: penicillin-binding protein 1C [Candidatus Marinimicrobia bacterium]|nr:penicillin-binding protein 1C [Candidatus Neomarinimicrobiota bacterium]